MLLRLTDPALYVSAFGVVAAKERERRSDESALPGAPALSGLARDVDALARRLASLVPAWRYELSPVSPRRALIEGRPRVLFHSPPLDVVVMTALAAALAPGLESAFSDRLFSYRPGRSNRQAVLQFGDFAKAYRAQRPDPRARGLYIVRRDVKSYGDAIPSGPSSALWSMLRRALASAGEDPSEEGWAWLMRAIRPPIAARESFALDPERGIPTGSPLQPLMGNLYLTEIDEACACVVGGFYARYGDDILFAHPDPVVARETAAGIDISVTRLGLRWSEEKCENLYLTAAGRPGAGTDYRPTTSTRYLGMRVDARGEVGLSADKATRLLRGVGRRLDAASRICGDSSLDDRAEAYCGVVNAVLDPEHPVADRAAQLLRYATTDRSQLKDLDYQLALRIAEHLTGVRGVRAFRDVPMRLLRRRYGLLSLVVERNRVEHARRGR